MRKALTYVEVDVPLFIAEQRAVNVVEDFVARGGSLTGLSDGKLLTGSVWLRINTIGTRQIILSGTTTLAGATFRLTMEITATGRFRVLGVSAAGTDVLDISSSVVTADEWHHFVFSVDLTSTSRRWLYVDGVSDLDVVTTYSNTDIDLTLADWGVFAAPDQTLDYEGGAADLWFDDSYIDLSVAANLSKFIRDGKPVLMGFTGDRPTGSSPLVFMTGEEDIWHMNVGTGGGFTLTGEFGNGYDFALNFEQTFRFTMASDYLPHFDIDAISCMTSVDYTPAKISLGENLGMRASVTASFKDFLHIFGEDEYDEGTFWGKWRGRYGVKLRGYNFRLIRGFLGQAISEMDTRHYVIENTSGPSINGTYTIEAKDIVKLADEDRSQAPIVSNGTLAGSINNAITSATLSPVGIGDLEYPASGYVCIGGTEVCGFTRSADVLTITRGDFGSTAEAHDSGDRVQLVLRYDGDDVADIIYDLMVNYAGIPAAYIDLDDWQAETSAHLGVIYAATITEPTSVRLLLNELIEQAALAVWWDERAQRVRLIVLREIATDTDTFDETRILAGSLVVTENPLKRISQQWTFYGQRDPTEGVDDDRNYRAGLASTDLIKQAEYNAPEIRQTRARWIETETAATRLNSIKLSRYRDPPRTFAFDLMTGESVTQAAGYLLEWWGNQSMFGAALAAKIQVTQVKILPDRIHVEAEEMLASGVILLVNVVFLTEDGSLNQWEVDASWNDADNSVEVIGGGGAGGNNSGTSGGAGGGGGAYSQITNLTLTPLSMVDYRVGSGGATGDASGTDTWFNGATLGASSVGAKAGTGGGSILNIGFGGDASQGVGTLKTSGGNGGVGAVRGETRAGGGGGGAAGGPHGDGGDGGGSSSTGADSGGGGGGADGGSTGNANGGSGGNNRFNFGGGSSGNSGEEGGGGGGGAVNSTAGGPGGNGEQLWTQTVSPITSAGPGGGGGGGGNNCNGGPGGLYGGGGGGKGGDAGQFGPGAQGIIVITWREA